MSRCRRCSSILPFAAVLLFSCFQQPVLIVHADRGLDGRHSYSLTTFDTHGKLGQVERAMEAAQRGTPIVAVCTSDKCGIILAAPQVLPSPLALDDGTPRFVKVSPEIVVAHSGLAADGRILAAAAQRLAVEHEYTFDENVDIAIFLEEMALLLQRYTSLPAARPFGASLLVAFVPSQSDLQQSEPRFFRIDPSGNVDALEGTVALVHGGSLESRTQLRDQLHEIANSLDDSSGAGEDDSRDKVVAVLQQALRQQAIQGRVNLSSSSSSTLDTDAITDQWTILTASLSRQANHGTVFRTARHEPS